MTMVIRQIKCAACKGTINSFYVFAGKCPVCGFIFASSKQPTSNAGLRQLKKEKKEYLKNTMSKGQIKSMFKLSDEQIAKIPTSKEFGEVRYSKMDVVKAVHTSY